MDPRGVALSRVSFSLAWCVGMPGSSSFPEWLWVSRRHAAPRRQKPSRQRRRARRAEHRRRLSSMMEDPAFEAVQVMEASSFVRHCQGFLPNPLRQAELDIPRMRVTVDGEAIGSLEGLLAAVPHSQGQVSAVLCTQTLFGPPYELAVELVSASAGAYAVVCEESPPEAGHIAFHSVSRGGGPRVAQRVVATKTMRGGRIDAVGRFERLCGVSLSVEVDLLWDTNGAVVAARVVG